MDNRPAKPVRQNAFLFPHGNTPSNFLDGDQNLEMERSDTGSVVSDPVSDMEWYREHENNDQDEITDEDTYPNGMNLTSDDEASHMGSDIEEHGSEEEGIPTGESDMEEQPEYEDNAQEMHSEGEDEELDLENPSQYFKLTKTTTHGSRKLRTKVCDYEIEFRGLERLQGVQLLQTFEPIFAAAIAKMTAGLDQGDYFRVTLANDSLNNPIAMPYAKVSTYTADYLFEQVANTLQSYTDFRLDETTKLCVVTTRIPKPGGYTLPAYQARRIASLPDWIKQKRTLISPKGNDALCGLKSIAIGMGICDQIEMKKVRTATWQNDRAMEISAASNVALGAISLNDIEEIQCHLAAYQISVYEPGMTSLSSLYSGPFRMKQINLLFQENHYFTIRSMKGLIDRRYFCIHCKKGYNNREGHHCDKNREQCFLCRHKDCKNRELIGNTLLSCNQCGKQFSTWLCTKTHDQETCDAFRRCTVCDTFVKTETLKPPSLHHCGLRWCRLCKKERPIFTDHSHYIPKFCCEPDTPPDEHVFSTANDLLFVEDNISNEQLKQNEEVFYLDFESYPELGNKHIVAISSVLRHEHGSPTYWFYGENTVKLFLDKVLSFDFSKTRYTIVSHYGSGFDHYCFLNAIFERKLCPNVVAKGTKFIQITVLRGRLRFIDSWMFLQMALRDMPRSFGIKEAKKGWFPYSVLSPESLEKTIPFPTIEAFEPEMMTQKDRKEFEKWYRDANEEFKTKPYNILDQLYEYNLSDVEVLRQSVQKFRSDYCRLHHIDPILRSMTLVSANFCAWRRNFIQEDSICIVSDCGFPRVRSSRMSAVWLTFAAEKEGIHIEGAHNGVEKRYGPFRVDGYSEQGPRILYQVANPDRETVWLFMGCSWHGCPQCYPRRDTVIDGRTVAERFAATKKTFRYFRQNQDVNIVVEWEHEFVVRLQRSNTLKALNKSFGNTNPWIKIREAYMGGRVECFRCMYRCAPNEKIFLFDFCSLYPFEMFSKGFWTGVPQIVRQRKIHEYGDIHKYRGIIYAQVVPPRELFIPILPSKINQKLLFTLCRTCAMAENTECACSDEERAITGVWTTDELFLALEHGYILRNVYEIWHYTDVDNTIFQDFVRLCLKEKAQASGFPEWFTEADKTAYITNYKRLYDIELDPSKIQHNPSMRLLNKLAVNALSGRLGMKTKRNELKYVTSFDSLRKLIDNPNLTINDIAVINEDLALVQCQKEADWDETQMLNIVMITQITSYARIELFRALKAAHNANVKILYTDTDSIYGVFPNDEPIPFETGSILGKLQNETTETYGVKSYIDQFWCTGAKSYAYRLINNGSPEVIYKLKGFRINSQVFDILSPEIMEELIKGERKEPLKIEYKHQLVRNVRAATLKERTVTKAFRFLNDKRMIDRKTWITYPWGYV